MFRRAASGDQWAYNCTLGHVLYLLSDFEGTDRALDLCWEKGVPALGVGGMRLIIAADVARRLGREDKAQRYLRWLEKELRIAEAEGIFPDDRLLAMYWAYKGRKDIAAEYLISSVRTRDFWSQAHQMVLLDDLTDQPAYLHAVKARQAELALQEAEVLEMLCGPEPVSRKYKPLPETCVQWQQAT